MDLAAKKLAFMKEYLHLSNEKLIDKLASILRNENKKSPSKKSLSDFYGIISEEEGNELIKNINDGCENIDNNEW